MVTTDGSCGASFLAKLAVSVPARHMLTATATDSANNTSEFSACVLVADAPALAINVESNQQLSLVWSNSPAGFILKETGSLSSPIQWTTVTNDSVPMDNRVIVSLPLTNSSRFYLLSFE